MCNLEPVISGLWSLVSHFSLSSSLSLSSSSHRLSPSVPSRVPCLSSAPFPPLSFAISLTCAISHASLVTPVHAVPLLSAGSLHSGYPPLPRLCSHTFAFLYPHLCSTCTVSLTPSSFPVFFLAHADLILSLPTLPHSCQAPWVVFNSRLEAASCTVLSHSVRVVLVFLQARCNIISYNILT